MKTKAVALVAAGAALAFFAFRMYRQDNPQGVWRELSYGGMMDATVGVATPTYRTDMGWGY